MNAIDLAPPGFKYRAFISYAKRDRRAAKWVHKAIEGYRIPRSLVGHAARDGVIPQRLFPIFRDRDELSSASDLSRSIRDALAQSAYLIVLCSPAAAQSRWVNQEILEFKRLGRADRIHALILDGDENTSFPPAFSLKPGIDPEADGQSPTEPLAADMRPEADGKRDAKLKLIAGLLGIPFNDLRKREVIAARKRAWVIRGIAITIAISTIGGGVASWSAWTYRNISEDLRVPGLRVERRETILDLSRWQETTDEDIRNKAHKSLGVSTNRFTIVRTHDYAKKFIHIAGSTSKTPPEVRCSGCNLVERTPTGANRARFEWNIEFDISSMPLDEPFLIEFQFIFWNAFQAEDQWWGGYRILHPTNVSLYTVRFPDVKHPLPSGIKYYYVDTKTHPLDGDGKSALVMDPRGRVAELTWEVAHPEGDRSYRVSWDWSK